MPQHAFYSFLLIPLLLASCHGNHRPNLPVINQDLGIEIPAQHRLIKADSDPFGLGADTKNVYVLQFDSLHFQLLEKSIKTSVLFNTADANQFEQLSLPQKIKIVRVLAVQKRTGYWIRSDSTYWFDGDSVLHTISDNLSQQLLSEHIFLPNQDSTSVWHGMAVTVYTVKAVVNRKKRTLYYEYVHI